MILLHSENIELSRSLRDSLPEGVEVVDCTQAPPEGVPISAYPTVAVDVPSYIQKVQNIDPDTGEMMGIIDQTVPQHQEYLRMPASWQAVDEFVAFAAARSADLTPG